VYHLRVRLEIKTVEKLHDDFSQQCIPCCSLLVL
jgi:hypothetical protein